ncbi:MAG: hypothetical protein WCC63_07035 [Candidatus Bathyarchaeia archaeon]
MRKAVLSLTCVLLAPMFLVGVSTSAPYDPWSDLDADGDIDIFDIVKIAGSYATTGDPGKNVSVTNWPTSTDVSVWWNRFLSPSSGVVSGSYNATGFGQLHVLVKAWELGAGESLTVEIYGELTDATHTSWTYVSAYTTTLTETSNARAITIPVPSERFAFWVSTDPASSCYVALSFYLTWS